MRKKKKQISGPIILALIVLTAVALIIFHISDSYFRAPMYPAFGIQLPAGYNIHGIDVSHHQRLIDWGEVEKMSSKGQKIGFTFMKATEGVSLVDPHFRRNWEQSSGTGLSRGAYHYFLAGRDGRLQAVNFIRTVKLKKGDLPPVLDVEETMGLSSEIVRRGVLEWLRLVEEHFGVKPIIYTNVHFYEAHLAGPLDKYPLWIAHYLGSRKPRIKRDWIFWQHNEGGRVSGIGSAVDFNVFNGDSSRFVQLLIR